MRWPSLILCMLSYLCYCRINIANAVSFALQMKYNIMSSQNCFFNDECFFDKFEAEEFFVEEQNQRQRTVNRVMTIKNAVSSSGNIDFGISERVLEKNLRAAIKNMETEFLCRDESVTALKNICSEAFENIYFKEQSWYYDESVIRSPECLSKTVEAHTFPVNYSERPVLACPTKYLDETDKVLSYFTVYLSATDKCCKNRFSYYVFVDDVQEAMPALPDEVIRKSLEMESLEVHKSGSEDDYREFFDTKIEPSHAVESTPVVSSISSSSTFTQEAKEEKIEDNSEGKFANLVIEPVGTLEPVPFIFNTSQSSTVSRKPGGKKLLQGSSSKSSARYATTVGTSAKVARDRKIREVGPSRCYSSKSLRNIEEQEAAASGSKSQSVSQKPVYKSARFSLKEDYEQKTSGFKTASEESKYTTERASKAKNGQQSVKFTNLEPSLAKYTRDYSRAGKQSARRASSAPPIRSTASSLTPASKVSIRKRNKSEQRAESQRPPVDSSADSGERESSIKEISSEEDSTTICPPINVSGSIVSQEDVELLQWAKNDNWLLGESPKHDDWSMFFEKTTNKDDSTPEHSPVDISTMPTVNSVSDDLIHSANNDDWAMAQNLPRDYNTAGGQRPVYVLTLLMNRHRKRK